MSKYQEYVEAAIEAGEDPVEEAEWRKMRLADGRAKAAAKKAADVFASGQTGFIPVVDPKTPIARPEPVAAEAPDRIIFWCVYRFGVQTMQSGHKTVVDNQIVVIPHRTIEFEEHHWTADMHNPDHVQKVEWLRHCQDFRDGKIVEVPDFRPVRQRVQIVDGPRTTGDRNIRPAATPPANVAEALTAPL